MARIHPTAIVDPRAEIADDVTVGAFTVIGPGVAVDAGTSIGHHGVFAGPTRIGRRNRFYHHVSIGEDPQDKKYAGEPTRLEIGDDNVVREFCTFNRGTVQDQGVTRIGDRNWIMAYVHIAHDCVVGDDTVFANSAQLAGHVEIGDHVTLGGYTGVHQFCRVGAHVMAGAASVVLQDVPPFVTVAGNGARPRGINAEGLRRRGFSPEQIALIRRGYRTLYRSGLPLEEARAAIAAQAVEHPVLRPLADFLARPGRGIAR